MTRDQDRRGEDERDVAEDDAFLVAFEATTLPEKAFDHGAHLRVAWLYLLRDRDLAPDRIVSGIRRFAAAHGLLRKYHETLTRFWIAAVDLRMRATSAGAAPETFAGFLARSPDLFDRGLVLQHYTRERLFSHEAREGFLPPDLLPLVLLAGADPLAKKP